MAWVAIDNFDSYADGDLAGENGGSGFSAGWVNQAVATENVQGTTVYQGTKAVTINNALLNTFYTRALTSAVSGNGNIVYFAIRRTLNNAGEVSISFRSNTGANSRVAVRMNSAGNITLVGSTTVTLVTGYSTSQWYAIRLTLNITAGTATAATSTSAYQGGGSWSSESSSVTLASTGNIDAVGLGTDASMSTDTFDIITSADIIAGTTNIKTVNGLAVGSVKTFDGLAIASVKTINGLA